MFKILFAGLLFLIFAQNIYAFTKVNVKYKEVSETAYEEGEQIFTRPYFLEKGNQWKIIENGKKIYAKVNLGIHEDPVDVELPLTEIRGEPYINFTFFSKQAGFEYIFDRKKMEICAKEYKAEEKSQKNKRIILMWDPDLIFGTRKNYFTEHVGERVLAPTWGGYKDMKEIPLSLSYLQEAKRAGMKITPLLHNDFDLQETKKLLHDSGAVQNLARQITATALVYDFDGWNLDFENMDEADKFLYTKFIKTVSEKLHMHGKEISVDITVNSNSPNWSLCYDRKGMAAYVDYEVIMGYDQTPGGSRYSGPVSSYSWLKHHIAMLLKQVPNNKLVLGLPFYTRIWTGKEGQVASSVLMMKQIKSLLGQNHIGLFWNPEDRQYVGIWEENGQTRKVWFEERRSLQEKVSLAHDYKLAGLAFWRYGFETEDIYDQIEGAFLNKKDESVRYKNRSEDILIKFRERLKRAQ